MERKRLYFDMDGVLVDFQSGIDKLSEEVLHLIEEGRIDTTPLITHRFPLSEIEEAYRIFENKLEGVIKVAIVNKSNTTVYNID
jgi:threonine dehydrogenase-like Zn-dependent dehydrogenase